MEEEEECLESWKRGKGDVRGMGRERKGKGRVKVWITTEREGR